ncbi:MAG: MBL fold metallo-hydrolase [Peptococcaceae bacterium]|nr:MBL fold metallo-hydrolase [Peptococcaceae bacterium]
MIKKLFDDIYRIKIPLPNNPLKATNSYFIRGRERNLLIDTGFNPSECQKAMEQAMQDIGFTMGETDLFITHAHGDHSGLTGYLAKPETKIY